VPLERTIVEVRISPTAKMMNWRMGVAASIRSEGTGKVGFSKKKALNFIC
jgi:hypothetical protein